MTNFASLGFAPVQGEMKPRRLPGFISWEEHLEAYTVYARKYGNGQSAQRIAERGGFGYKEVTNLLGHEPKTWVDKWDSWEKIQGETNGNS